MFRDTMIDNNWAYTECQASYNIWGIDSSNVVGLYIYVYTRMFRCQVWHIRPSLVSFFFSSFFFDAIDTIWHYFSFGYL